MLQIRFQSVATTGGHVGSGPKGVFHMKPDPQTQEQPCPEVSSKARPATIMIQGHLNHSWASLGQLTRIPRPSLDSFIQGK